MPTIKVEIPADRPDLAEKAAELFALAAKSAGEQIIDDLNQIDPVVNSAPPVSADQNTAAEQPPAVDLKGVTFNAEMCGNGKDPFYASGSRQGQWKKRRGVDEDDYDAWYKGELAAAAPDPVPPQAPVEPAPINTQGAFPNAAAAPDPVPPPADCGAFMAWVSKKQAAGLLSQDDIGAAYQEAGVSDVMQLFPPTPAETIAQNVKTLYELLSGKAGA